MTKLKDLESIMLSRNKAQKDKYHMIPLYGKFFLKKELNKHKKTETDFQIQKTDGGCQSRGNRGMGETDCEGD